MKFNSFCTELKIGADKSDLEKLPILQEWFEEHVSRDLHYKGNEQEQIASYKEFTEKELDHFLPNIEKKESHLGKDELFSAASKGLDRIILLSHPDRASLNVINSYGISPLHLAAAKGNFNTVSALISLGANVAFLNQQNQYPLYSALLLPVLYEEETKQNKIKIFRLLLEQGPKLLSHQDERGDTVLHQMANVGFDVLIEEVLKTNNELAALANNFGHYPIHAALLNNQIPCIKLLLEIKGTENFADHKGMVPLHYAACYSSPEILNQCCDLTPNIDVTDMQGRTPLMLAALSGRLFAVQILIKRKAQIDLKDSSGLTARDYAAQSGNFELINWLSSQ